MSSSNNNSHVMSVIIGSINAMTVQAYEHECVGYVLKRSQRGIERHLEVPVELSAYKFSAEGQMVELNPNHPSKNLSSTVIIATPDFDLEAIRRVIREETKELKDQLKSQEDQLKSQDRELNYIKIKVGKLEHDRQQLLFGQIHFILCRYMKKSNMLAEPWVAFSLSQELWKKMEAFYSTCRCTTAHPVIQADDLDGEAAGLDAEVSEAYKKIFSDPKFQDYVAANDTELLSKVSK